MLEPKNLTSEQIDKLITYSYITNKCKVTDVFNEGVARVENMQLLCTYELCNEVIYRVK